MSSEAAQKAYPKNDWTATEGWLMRAAFDRGAVEALRQAAYAFARSGHEYGAEIGADLERMADDWVVGQ